METVPTPTSKAQSDEVLTLACDCGFELEERNQNALIEQAQRHAAQVHGMRLGADQVAASIRRMQDTSRSSRPARSEEER